MPTPPDPGPVAGLSASLANLAADEVRQELEAVIWRRLARVQAEAAQNSTVSNILLFEAVDDILAMADLYRLVPAAADPGASAAFKAAAAEGPAADHLARLHREVLAMAAARPWRRMLAPPDGGQPC